MFVLYYLIIFGIKKTTKKIINKFWIWGFFINYFSKKKKISKTCFNNFFFLLKNHISHFAEKINVSLMVLIYCFCCSVVGAILFKFYFENNNNNINIFVVIVGTVTAIAVVVAG